MRAPRLIGVAAVLTAVLGCGRAQSGTDAQAGFDVASLPGLSLWLDASRGVSDPTVRTWHDQSPNDDDAIAGAMAPDYLHDELNGYPAVQLQGTATMTVSGPKAGAAMAFGADDVLVEVVARWLRAVTLFQTNYGLTVSGDAAASVTVGGDPVSAAGTNVGDGTFHLIGARRSGSGAATTLDVRVDGALAATATSIDFARDLGSIAEGPVGALGPGNNVELVEVVVVKGPIAAASLSGLEGDLRAKYALP